jgi:hypothetical protein
VYAINYKPLQESPVAILKITRQKESSPKNQSQKIILFWTRFFNDQSWYTGGLEELGEDFLNSIKCPVSNCLFTHNRNLVKEMEFDAILFHTPEHMNLTTIPKSRSPHQIYTFVSLE